MYVYFDGRFDKTAVAGVVDEMEQDAFRVESNSAHFVVVRGVNTASERSLTVFQWPREDKETGREK